MHWCLGRPWRVLHDRNGKRMKAKLKHQLSELNTDVYGFLCSSSRQEVINCLSECSKEREELAKRFSNKLEIIIKPAKLLARSTHECPSSTITVDTVVGSRIFTDSFAAITADGTEIFVTTKPSCKNVARYKPVLFDA